MTKSSQSKWNQKQFSSWNRCTLSRVTTETVLGGILPALCVVFPSPAFQLHSYWAEQMVISWADDGFVFSDRSSMKCAEKSHVNLISLALTSRNFNSWIIEITFLIIQKGPTCFFLLGQTQFIMFMHYLIRYLEGWSCATRFNPLKNCVDLSLGNSGGSTEKPRWHEYSPAGFQGIWSQLYHQLQ